MERPFPRMMLGRELLDAQNTLAALIKDDATDCWQVRSIDQHVRNAWNEYAAWINYLDQEGVPPRGNR